jgi:hypothetical protein
MPATPTLLEQLTGAVTRDVAVVNANVWESAHTANPGSTGAHEITTGIGVGGRQQVTFNAGISGVDESQTEIDIVVAGAVTVPWVGFWDSQVGGTFLGGYPLVTAPCLAVAIVAFAIVFCPGHGRAIGDVVRLFTAPNAQSSIPAPLSGDPSLFYVVATPSVDQLELATTHGGAPLTLVTSGGFILAKDNSQSFTDGGVLAFAVANITYETVS